MLHIERQTSLKLRNTFRIQATSRELVEFNNESQLAEIYAWLDGRTPRILGGGSNLLITKDVAEPVLAVQTISPLRLQALSASTVSVTASAGMPWHQLVLMTLEQGLTGLENLSLIPGTVGASPIQNIGAYGVEVKDRFLELLAWNWKTNEFRRFDAQELAFGYRDSLFKQTNGEQWVLLSVTFALMTEASIPKQSSQALLQLDYGEIRSELRDMGITSPKANDVSKAVIKIRSRKLPDPTKLPNAGSFFKNPLVSSPVADQLKQQFPGLPVYTGTLGRNKLSAGWMIDQCGWKGKSMGDAAVHDAHALVLVNRGQASGAQVQALAAGIQDSVRQRFGIELEPEPVAW